MAGLRLVALIMLFNTAALLLGMGAGWLIVWVDGV